ncbi:hypothetical protein D1007_43826 [Hordeum vulgare]|nr:hypothetical protein D1007_43826 [Hordeum vulgare]
MGHPSHHVDLDDKAQGPVCKPAMRPGGQLTEMAQEEKIPSKGSEMQIRIQVKLVQVLVGCYGKVVPDEYDEQSYCLYDTDASTVYGVCAFFVLLLAQLLVTSITRCFCFGPALSSCGCTLAAFAVSWCASLNPRFGSIRALL